MTTALIALLVALALAAVGIYASRRDHERREAQRDRDRARRLAAQRRRDQTRRDRR
jgi:uncharacterized protein HemX